MDTLEKATHKAIMDNNLEALKLLNINTGHIILGSRSDLPLVAINVAIINSNLDMVQYLFERGALPVNEYYRHAGSDALQSALVRVDVNIDMVSEVLNRILTVVTSAQQKILEKEGQFCVSKDEKDVCVFDPAKYDKAVKEMLQHGLLRACQLGRVDIVDLLLTQASSYLNLAEDVYLTMDAIRIILETARNNEALQIANQGEEGSNEYGDVTSMYGLLDHILKQPGVMTHVTANIPERTYSHQNGEYEYDDENSIQQIIYHLVVNYSESRPVDKEILTIFMKNGLNLDKINLGSEEGMASMVDQFVKDARELNGPGPGGKRRKRSKTNKKKKRTKKRATRSRR